MEKVEYEKWLKEFLSVDDLNESSEVMDIIDFTEAIMEFEKSFNCIVEEGISKPDDFKTLNDFIDFLLKFTN